MSLTNPLARARGLGSAKTGVDHWFAQRATAVLLVFLLSWGLYAAIALAGADFLEARAFMARPLNAALMIVLLVGVLYHAMLGLQVVIEDYVHHRPMEWTLQLLVRAAGWFGIAIGTVYVLRIALGAPA